MLVLERLFAWEVPDTFAVSGVGATPGGQVFAWSAERSTGMLHSDDGWVRFDLGTPDPVGLTVLGNSSDLRLTVLDGSSRRLVEVDEGEVRDGRTVEGEGAFLRGVATPAGWFVSRGVEGRIEVVWIPTEGPPAPVFRLEPPGLTEVQLHPWNGRDVLITEVRHPFRTFGISPAGDTLEVFDPPLDSDPDSDGFAALPMLPVGEGFLQVLADLTSTRRVLVTYDRNGTRLRQRTVEGRIGLTRSVPGHAMLLGMQDIGRQEVVAFRWRWSEDAR